MQKEFGYARVSTARQHEDRQVQALLEYGIEERNIIVDKESGKDFDRLGYLSLKEKWLRRGDTLVVKELDRLGRNKAKIREELEGFRAEGIAIAQEKGVVFGRPVVAEPDNFEMVMALVDSGQLKAVEAMRELGVKKTTYYKMRRSFLQAADRV